MEGGERSYKVDGRFTEVVENERLVRTALMPPGGETVVTVTFEAGEGGTKVVLTQDGFESDEGAQNANHGWSESFEKRAGTR
jgi:uncharacterized protein YndB with AHSA1/START domain